ncbi:LPD38 domain-containing protein [Aeromonas hydrophila]
MSDRRMPTYEDFLRQEMRNIPQPDPEPTSDQGVIGDTVDMFQRGVGQTFGGDAETLGQLTDSQTIKDAGRAISDWGEGQMQEVSPEMRAAMGKQFVVENPDGSISAGEAWADPRAYWGNFATVLGQFAGLIGGTKGAGVVAKPLIRGMANRLATDLVEGEAKRLVAKATVKDALKSGTMDSVRAAYAAAPTAVAKKAVIDKAVGQLAFIGYGAHAGAMASGMRAQQAERETRDYLNNLGPDALNENADYQSAYWGLADGEMNGADPGEIRSAAISYLSEQAASNAFQDPRALASDFASGLLTGAGGGIGGALGKVGQTRVGAAVRGFVGEGATEGWQGAETQRAVNEAVQEWADETRDPMAGVLVAGLNEAIVGGMAGGGLAGVVGPEVHISKPVVRTVTGNERIDQGIGHLDQRQAERGAAIEREIDTLFAGKQNPLGESSQAFDPVRDIPAYQRQGFVRGSHDFKGTEIPGPLEGELLAPETGLAPLNDSTDPILQGGSAAQELADLAGGRMPPSGRPAVTDQRLDGDLMPQELGPERAGLPGATIEGDGREVGTELPYRDFIVGEDGRPAQRRAADIQRRGRELADQPAQIGQSDTLFVPGKPGADPRNSAYTPPRLSRDQVDRSLGEESTRDPRSPVSQAIANAGSATDSVFGPLQSLRVTKRGKQFASQKEAQLASRADEQPVALNGGGFGVANRGEVEQAKAADQVTDFADRPTINVSGDSVTVPSSAEGAASQPQAEVRDEQIAPVSSISGEGQSDQPGAGVPTAAGAEPAIAGVADGAGAGDRADLAAPAPVPDGQQQDDQALTAPAADAGVVVSGAAQPDPVAVATPAASEPAKQIEAARAEVSPEPTEAQKEAGNYKKGHLKLQGLDIALENPKGSIRSGTDQDGKAWQSTMAHDYGYIKRTLGADGDHVDVFIGDQPQSETVYVVDQVDPKTGKFDEHKVMMGFADEQAARDGYLANYEKGWKGLGAIKAMPVEEFKSWLKAEDTTKPISHTKSASQDKIGDFGEKIGGARKDVFATYKDDIKGGTAEEIKELPLSQAWPAPDYQQLIDSGLSPKAAALMRSARDIIPAKPRSGYKVASWAKAVKAMRDMALGMLDGSVDPATAARVMEQSSLRGADTILNRSELYEAVGHQRSLADLDLSVGSYSLFEGREYNPPKAIWTVRRESSGSNWPRIIVQADSKAQAIDEFKRRYEELTSADRKPKAATFDIYSEDGRRTWRVGKKVGRNYIPLSPVFNNLSEARTYRDERHDELVKVLEARKAIPNERRDLNQPRVGEDMRGGADVTPQLFTDAFGFRGVEFGNWVDGKRRQQDLNNAFDALMDMAAVLGIPPKALSLNGKLGLAFGARGSGGVNPAAAHFEPGKVVINLTKMNGAGSLGHEWWHALDDYFAKLRSGKENMTEALDVELASRGSNFAHRGEVRREMVEAFGAVMRSIKQTALKARASKLDSKRTKQYWTTNTEMSARSFESYLIAKLQDQGVSNDYLANIVDEATWEASSKLGWELDDSYPYPTAGEVPAIRAGFDHFFDTLDAKQDGDRVILFSKKAMAQGDKPARHLTQKEAELVAREWFKQYRGASGIDVQIHATQAELEKALGLAAQDGLIRRAAFDDDSGTLHVAADTIANPKRMREILRHEVLAHYGLANVLGDGEYTKLMSRLIQSQKDPSMKPVWDWVNTHYADEDIGTQAEEVVAHLAELEQGAWGRGWDRVVAWVTRALRAVGFVPDGITAAETRSLIEGLGKKLRKADAEVGAAEGEKLWFSAERSPWGKDFPEVILHGRLADATSHPDYVAAKGGDDAAARRLVRDVLSPDAIGKLKALVGVRPAIALGVHAEEAVSRNAIPSAMADILGKVLGIEVDLDIMQSAKVGRTAQDGFGRLANQPGFDGPVRNDKPYLIMDDTLTQGGTLANLKGYIENRGGEVLAATALTGKQYSAKIAIDSSTLEQLRDQYDGTGLEAWWHNRFGYGFDSLTESEGRYLLRAKDADKVRDRVAAAGPQTSARSEYESARDDGSLPPNGLKFSQTNSAADEALQKLNLGPKPDIIDKTKASLNKLRQVDRGVVSSWIDRVIKKANTEVLDALAPIKYAEEAAGITDAADSGYVAARMATGAASTMQATMLYGLPEWNDGVIQRKAGTGEKDALLGIFADLGADLHNWLGWMAGHRAELLMAQGRENLLDANDIAALKGQGKGKEAKFKEAKARWNRLNAATLDLAQEAGLFTKEARAEFENEWYIPFFRESDDGDVIAPFKTKGIANQNAGIKKLKGGEANTNDLLENIFTSTSKLIDASMKNMAAQKTVWNLADTGIIEVIPKPNKMDYQALANGKDRIMVKLEGEDYMIRVEDPDLYRAMTFFDRKPFSAMVNVAAKAKRLLTAGVTASPEFMLRNFLRDSLSSWAISKDGFRPVIDSIKGVKKTLAMDGSTIDVMFSGASFLGGYVNGNDPEAMADTVRKSLRRKGMTPEQIARYEKSIIRNAAQAKGVVANAWEKYNRYGEAFENANREAVYAAAIKAGKSHAQAAFESKDLMDFSMLGASRTMQVMTQLLPFFNARVQGLGKLTRELRDNPRAIAKRAGMITAASLALLAANWDDERYEELPDWDKDANWHFFVGDQHFRIPKPFEIGVLFGTIPERMVRALGDKDSGAQFGKAVARAIGDTFALNPIPQIAKPVVETTVNYDFFKGGPIDGPQDLNVQAEARYNEQTSLLMRELGELTGFSPKQLEHLVIGYTGTMGSYVMAAADGLIRASRPGESASWRADEIPLVKAVYRGTGPAKSTQHMEEFYRMLNEVNQLKRTVDQYRSEGLTDKANELLEEQGGILKSRRSLSRTQQQVRVVRNRIELIQRDRTMTAEEKRRRIDEMLARRNDLVYQAVNKNKANWE